MSRNRLWYLGRSQNASSFALILWKLIAITRNAFGCCFKHSLVGALGCLEGGPIELFGKLKLCNGWLRGLVVLDSASLCCWKERWMNAQS